MTDVSLPSVASHPPRPGRVARNLALAAFATAALVLLAQPAAMLAWTANTFNASSESLMVQLHNQARANAGVRALTVDSTLATEARNRSKDMIDKNYFSHSIPPDGHSVFDELRAMGYCLSTAGENIGWNTYPDGPDTQAMFDSFMSSSAHRSDILGPDWTKIGVGAYQGTTDQKMWTVLFALPCGSTPPTPAPTARPTPTPTPRPATPRPTAAATPVAPNPTDAPPPPEPEASPSPTPIPSLPPDLERPDVQFTPAFSMPNFAGPIPTPGPSPTPTPAPVALAEGVSLRVIDPPPLQGLFEAIVGGVTGLFFGS